MKSLNTFWKYIFILFCLSSSLCFSQDTSFTFFEEYLFRQLTFENLNKSFSNKSYGYKEMKVYIYNYEQAQIDTQSQKLLLHVTFDKKGNVINRKKLVDQNNLKYSTEIYKYNKANKPTKYIYRYNSIRKYRKGIWKYRNDTILFESSIETYRGNKYTDISRYDRRGNELYYILYVNDKLAEESTTTNNYDDTGKLREQVTIAHYSNYFTDIGVRGRVGTYSYRYHRTGDIGDWLFVDIPSVPRNQAETTTTTYIYNEKEELSEKVQTFLTNEEYDNRFIASTFTYNIDGKIMTENTTSITKDGKVYSGIIYDYDYKDTFRVETFFHDEISEPYITIYYKANNKKHIIEAITYNRDNQPDQIAVYEYK